MKKFKELNGRKYVWVWGRTWAHHEYACNGSPRTRYATMIAGELVEDKDR